MKIERTDKEIIIRIPSDVKIEDLQRFCSYLEYKEAIAKSQATQEDIDALVKEIKKGWRAKNRHHFIK